MFPEVPRTIANPPLECVYRFSAHDSRRLYIGETDSLPRRLDEYRSAAPSTNARVRQWLSGGDAPRIRLYVLRFSPFLLGRYEVSEGDLGDPNVRRMLEQMMTVFYRRRGAKTASEEA